MTPHFTLQELTHSDKAIELDLDNTPNAEQLANLKRLAVQLELCRTLLNDNPLIISSGFRSIAVNRAVGGVDTSAHCGGYAADFTCPGFGDPKEVVKRLKPFLVEFDQLIFENKGGKQWVHLGVGPRKRRQIMTIDDRGARLGV